MKNSFEKLSQSTMLTENTSAILGGTDHEGRSVASEIPEVV